MINWVYFPKSSPPPEFGLRIVALFEKIASAIDSSKRAEQPSDFVMAKLRPCLDEIGFKVEKGKSGQDKIVVPVLFGRKGKILKCFNADAHAAAKGWVFEVETKNTGTGIELDAQTIAGSVGTPRLGSNVLGTDPAGSGFGGLVVESN